MYVTLEEILLRDQIYEKEAQKNPNLDRFLVRARSFCQVLSQKKIRWDKEDYMAGHIGLFTYESSFPMQMTLRENFWERPAFQMDVDRELQELQEENLLATKEEQKILETFAKDVKEWTYKHWHGGHTLADYGFVIKKGFPQLKKELEEKKENGGNYYFYQGLIEITQGIQKYICRYEQMIVGVKEATIDAKERKKLSFLVEVLQQIQKGPAQDFFQALQLYWLLHEMMYCENMPSGVSLGRLDYELYPFYQATVEGNKEREKKAEKWVEDFFRKCAEHRKAYQNLTLGGEDAKGRAVLNPLTFLCLSTCKKLHLDQPLISFRWPKEMTDQGKEKVLELIKEGMGFPALFNDEICKAARKKSGVLEKYAWNYAMIGCVELSTPGREVVLSEMVRVNMPKVLLEVMDTMPTVNTFAEFCEEVLQGIEKKIDMAIFATQKLELLYEKRYPLPFLTLLMPVCLEQEVDVMGLQGSAYQVGINLCGIGTLVDSLLAVERLVYDKRFYSLKEYREIVRRDFEKNETAARLAATHCPKFGNNHDRATVLYRNILERFEQRISKKRNAHQGPYRLGLYSVEDHAIMGRTTMATPDGRRKGEALSNSVGPSQGKDTEGPTALINDVTAFSMEKATNGMVLDISFTPEFIESETGKKALFSLIATYFKKRGMEIQISVLSQEQLRKAQKNPKKYANLIVRVSGFSAYFIDLKKETQEEIIKRTKYS